MEPKGYELLKIETKITILEKESGIKCMKDFMLVILLKE